MPFYGFWTKIRNHIANVNPDVTQESPINGDPEQDPKQDPIH
jgi:hypothetical protein